MSTEAELLVRLSRYCVCAMILVAVPPGVAHSDVQSGFGVAAGGGIAAGEESYKTDLFTGSATLPVPLVLPPGTNGHQPRLALSYHSGRGNGWMGQGWDLTVPSVRRVVKHGVPSYSDDLELGDRFEIGDDILVRDDAGLYRLARDNFDRIQRFEDGSGNVTHWVLNRRDGGRLEFGMDAEHRVLGKAPDPLGLRTFEWLLTRELDSNGNYIEYTYFDRVANELGVDEAPHLKRIAYSFRGDTSAATIRTVDFVMQDRPDRMVSYRGAVHTRMFKRLDRIDVLAGGSPVTSYDIRYFGESPQEGALPANQRSLVRRVVRLGANGSPLPADEYSYWGDTAGVWTRDSTSSSQLASLRVPEIGGGSEATAPNLNPLPIDLSQGNRFRVVDVNGDARPDLVSRLDPSPARKQRGTFINDGTSSIFPSTFPPRPFVEAFDPSVPLTGSEVVIGHPLPTQFSGSVIRTGTRVVDVDRDGRPELLIGHALVGQSTSSTDVYRNHGKNWSFEGNSGYGSLPAHLVTIQYDWDGLLSSMLVGWTELLDVNGDGRADLLEHRAPGSVPYGENGRSAWIVRNVYLNNGDGWTPSPDPQWSAALSSALDTLQVFSYQLLPVDINGDGLIDLAADKLPALCSGLCNFDGLPGGVANGGDIADLARGSDGAVDPDSATTDPVVLVNTGRGWVVDSDFPQVPGLRPIDVDGDGLVDDAQTQARLNTGTGFVDAPFDIPFSFGSSAGGRVLADLDGDAQVDLIRADGSNFDVYLSDSNPVPGLLRRIDSLTGGTVEIYYEASSEGSCTDTVDGGCHQTWYASPDWSSSDPRCVYPWKKDIPNDRCILIAENLPFPVHSATRVVTDDRTGNIATVDTAFDFGRFNRGVVSTTDREFRGFGLAQRYGPTTTYMNPKNPQQTISFSTLDETQFYQEDFLRGEPARIVRYRLEGGDRQDRSHVMDITVPEFALAHGGSANWAVFMTVFSEEGCGEAIYLGDPTSCPEIGTTKQEYVDFGASLSDPSLPYQGFIDAFASPGNRDRNDAFLVLPISQLSRRIDDPSLPSMKTEFRSFQWHDRAGNVKFAWDMGATRIDVAQETIIDLDPGDDRMTLTTFAVPHNSAPLSTRDRPLQRSRHGFASSGAVQKLSETWFSYDGLANNDPNGQVTAGNLTRRSDWLFDPLNSPPTTNVFTDLTYDSGTSFGLARTITDPYQENATQFVTTYTYDQSNTFPTSITRGLLTTTLSYNVPSPAPRGLGLLYSKTDSNSEVTLFGYDEYGRPTSRAGPGAVGAVKTTAYNDVFGWNATEKRRTETISDGTTPIATDIYLDGLGREIRALRSAKRPDTGAPAVIEETAAYDLRGNIRAVTRPRFCAPGGASCDSAYGTSHLYDARDQLTYVVQPDGGIQERRRETRIDPDRTDPERFEVSTDAAGRRRDIRLDGAGSPAQLIEYKVANDYTTGIERTNYLYDGLGRLKLICDPLADPCTVTNPDPEHTTIFMYDTLSRVTRRKDPDRGQWSYRFRGDGAPLRQTDGNGIATAFSYDALYGRLKTVDWSANGSADVTYTYGDELGTSAPPNSRGRLYRRAGPTSTLELAYDTSVTAQ